MPLWIWAWWAVRYSRESKWPAGTVWRLSGCSRDFMAMLKAAVLKELSLAALRPSSSPCRSPCSPEVDADFLGWMGITAGRITCASCPLALWRKCFLRCISGSPLQVCHVALFRNTQEVILLDEQPDKDWTVYKGSFQERRRVSTNIGQIHIIIYLLWPC